MKFAESDRSRRYHEVRHVLEQFVEDAIAVIWKRMKGESSTLSRLILTIGIEVASGPKNTARARFMTADGRRVVPCDEFVHHNIF